MGSPLVGLGSLRVQPVAWMCGWHRYNWNQHWNICRGAFFQIQTFWALEAEQYLLFVRQKFSSEFCALEYWDLVSNCQSPVWIDSTRQLPPSFLNLGLRRLMWDYSCPHGSGSKAHHHFVPSDSGLVNYKWRENITWEFALGLRNFLLRVRLKKKKSYRVKMLTMTAHRKM